MRNPDTPLHVVIIPDGNRRWAQKKHLPTLTGHMEGYTRTKELLKEAHVQGVAFLTLWAFSTENWSRSDEAVKNLLALIEKGLQDLEGYVHEEKIRFVHLGRKDRLNSSIMKLIVALEAETGSYDSLCLCLAIDYGGEDEVSRAGKALLSSGDTSKSIRDFLDTTRNSIPDPDLVIRTSGETRTSGLMPLQSAYSEWFFEETLFPDFTPKLFVDVLTKYKGRVRRFGK